MIRLREARSDADLEAWRRVRIAVVPNERAGSIEELRHAETPERLLLLAEVDGEGSHVFARRVGFREVDRQAEQVRDRARGAATASRGSRARDVGGASEARHRDLFRSRRRGVGRHTGRSAPCGLARGLGTGLDGGAGRLVRRARGR